MVKRMFIPWWKTSLGKQETLKLDDAIRGQRITQGKLTEELEGFFAKALGTRNVLLTTNGSSALLAALIACDVSQGDEVIVPDLTFIATAQAPLLLGAKVKPVDVGPRRPLIEVSRIEQQITPKTKVIIAVHLNGMAADIADICKLAKRNRIKVIEDAAQALFSRNSEGFLGTQADIGIFSLGATKLVTTGQGGLLAARDKHIFCRLKSLRNNDKSSGCLSPGNLGFNFKFNDILAGIGLGQISRLNKRISLHKDTYDFYKKGIKGLGYIKMIEVEVKSGELPLWPQAVCIERDRVVSLLKGHGIQALPFDPPLSVTLKLKGRNNFRHSRQYADHGLVLPSGPGQEREDLNYVVNILKQIDSRFNVAKRDQDLLARLSAL